MAVPLTSDFSRDDAVPYFLWDEPLSVREVREVLAGPRGPARTRLLARMLREARDTDVWRFVTPRQVADEWLTLEPLLGRRRLFWTFLLGRWREEGLLA